MTRAAMLGAAAVLACALGCDSRTSEARAPDAGSGAMSYAAESGSDPSVLPPQSPPAPSPTSPKPPVEDQRDWCVARKDGTCVGLDGPTRDRRAVEKIAGIYEITSHTENDRSCAREGASVLETATERMFVLMYVESRLVVPTLAGCATLEQCRELAAKAKRGGSYSTPRLFHSFDRVEGRKLSAKDGDTGSTSSDERSCEGARWGSATLTWDGDEARFEWRGASFSHPRSSSCTSWDELRRHAAGRPCNRLVVARARRIE